MYLIAVFVTAFTPNELAANS